MYEVTEKILREVRKVIVGKDDVVEKVWISILAQGHVLLEDVTQMAEYVFAHRLMLSSKARLNEYTPEAIVAEVLAQTQPPVLSERRA